MFKKRVRFSMLVVTLFLIFMFVGICLSNYMVSEEFKNFCSDTLISVNDKLELKELVLGEEQSRADECKKTEDECKKTEDECKKTEDECKKTEDEWLPSTALPLFNIFFYSNNSI